MEIWQYVSRTPVAPEASPVLGDHGIFATKIKCRDIEKAFTHCKKIGVNILGSIGYDPLGNPHFFIKDPYDNVFEIVKGQQWFSQNDFPTGGPAGAIIGVSDIEQSRVFYEEILGYDEAVYEREGVFDDFSHVEGGSQKVKRVLLKHSQPRRGAFSKVLGPSTIELVQLSEGTGKKMFEGRFWGDLGFIHLCFDINGMDAMRALCSSKGHPFTVDSADSFDMGEAAGHFSYIEDPDGTLIEFVETHKIPIVKKVGWYLNLRKRNPEKALPDWMLRSLSFSRVKD